MFAMARCWPHVRHTRVFRRCDHRVTIILVAVSKKSFTRVAPAQIGHMYTTPPLPAKPSSAAPIYRVNVRGPYRGGANYEIKEHTKNRRDIHGARHPLAQGKGSLQYLLDGENIGENQTPSSLSHAGFTDGHNIYVDCFLLQGRPHTARRQ